MTDDRRRAKGDVSKMPTQRMLQVGEEVRHVLAQLLRHYQPFPHQAREVSITVTEVRMSPDLKHATVFVMPLAGGEEVGPILLSLKKNAGSVVRMLAGKLPFKFLPILRFQLDESLDRAHRIETLLKEKR